MFYQRKLLLVCYGLGHGIYWEIYYDPIVGHFATMIDGVIYDITGVVENTIDFISLEEIRKDELLWARLQRDCVDLGVGMENEV